MQARNHLDQEDWQQAADLFTAIEQEQPGYREAAALVTTAQRQRDLAAWSDQAEAAAGHDDWDTALTALENICAVDRTYRDAGARLEQAQSAKRLRCRTPRIHTESLQRKRTHRPGHNLLLARGLEYGRDHRLISPARGVCRKLCPPLGSGCACPGATPPGG